MSYQENVSLKEFTTMRTGGPARYFFSIQNTDDLKQAALFIKKHDLPFFILGGGSNVLVSDEGFPGVVLHMQNKGITFDDMSDGKVRVTAAAGEVWDDLVMRTVDEGLWGLENLSLIPGSVGAAPVQNIGAYGTEAKDVIREVEVFDMDSGSTHSLSNAECAFEYRDSVFKKNTGKNFFVTKVTLALSKTPNPILDYKDVSEYIKNHNIATPTISDMRNALVDIRTRKLPSVTEVGTAGSFFKNPVVSVEHFETLKQEHPDMPGIPNGEGRTKIPAGWLIENIARWKGKRVGDVGVHDKQALVLVNYGDASTKDVNDVATEIERTIKEKTNIILEREVITIK